MNHSPEARYPLFQRLPAFAGATLKLLLVILLLALLLTACGGTNPQPNPGASTWDSAKWDSAKWQP